MSNNLKIQNMETKRFEIVSAQSSIDWVGRKITGAHNALSLLKREA
jgi:hypothetical protein